MNEIMAEEGRVAIANVPKQETQQQTNQPTIIPSQVEKNEKSQEFKIQVRIIEGRHLTGNNIKPVVKVKIGHQAQHTRIGTGNNPYFNQIETTGNHEDDDVENNLLLTSGVARQTVTSVVKVYRANDIPQMDDTFLRNMKGLFRSNSDKKNLADPFTEIAFAGEKVLTKIIKDSCSPIWNQAITLPMKLPSMCDNIRLRVYDWDRANKNDLVGTANLALSKISLPPTGLEGTGLQEGFLPTFGPSYINFYGSPREFKRYPDHYDELNYGNGEGVAYRGRILVELTSKLCDSTKMIEDISNQDVLAVERYQYKRKYSLCAVFHSATMLQDASEAVQFEVSMANYGNKFDRTCKALPSTTPYRQPIFDGDFYYYLPWYASKPVVALTSYWEDISHRLDVVNILTALTDRLQSGVSSMKSALQANLTETEVVSILQNLLDQLIEDAGKPLPSMEGKNNVNELDMHRRKLQQSVLTQMKAAAANIRREVTDVKSTLPVIEEWIDRLQHLSEEPQNSMPDIIIWMIKAEKRVAYARIPAHQILFSKTREEACGKFCGKIQTVFLKFPLDKQEGRLVPVQLRVNLWLGLSEAEGDFINSVPGTFRVHAEMYENESRISGRWSSRFLLNHHKFSDATGTIKLRKKSFVVPEGWKWESDWQVDNERSLPNEDYNEHLEITEELFENERRLPNGKWQKEEFTNANGEKSSSPDKVDCPHGWIWDDDTWKSDVNRAVDENGWEYGRASTPDNQPQHWVSSEKTYHTHRRRRLVRRRSKLSTPKEEVIPPKKDKGWEYAGVSGWRFHMKKCSTDTFRRRHWIRTLVSCGQQDVSSIFNLEGNLIHGNELKEGENDSKDNTRDFYREHVPFVSCKFDRVYKYHLRCYMYQARGLTPMDRDSFSDPYAHVSFLYLSKRTEIITCTLNPTWDQTLVFSDIEICGEPREIEQNPPIIVIEIYDSDPGGEDDFLGRGLFFPMVKLDPNIKDTPKLLWSPITNGKRHCGDILVAAELFLLEHDGCILPVLPTECAPNVYMVPEGIRPVLQLTCIEVLTWGLRNISHLESARASNLIVECGGETVETAITGVLGRNPSFQSAVLFLKVYLPQEEMYTPPIIIKVIANRHFGRKEVVGQCTIEQLEDFSCDPYTTNQDDPPDLRVAPITTYPATVIDVEGAKETLLAKEEEDDVDWWAKFFVSKGELDKSDLYNTLMVYNCELERVPEFLGLTDFCQTFTLHTGKAKHDEEPMVAGEFKGSFCIYQLPEDPDAPLPPQHFRELPDSGPQECIVRVYIVRGIDLQPKDNNGLCDPYIKLSLNKKVVADRENYVPNTLNPVFGRMYELSCILPQEKDLKISVYDYDALSGDDKVGETTIDLENRLLSRFRSHCGLPETYCTSGVNQWRDQLKPTEILQSLARCRALPPPVYEDDGRTLIFSGMRYTSASTEKEHIGPINECLALQVLRNQGLVPEHVETRTLYSTCQPDIPQGKVEMWVDIFPKSLGPPGPAVNITPRKPKRFVLRAIVWNTKDVILDDVNVFGENMSDIYVKGWLDGIEEDKQRTEVHYRSMDGEGNFNWRFVFPFDYLPTEQKCIISKKEHIWSLDATEIKLPPKLVVQIWDNDKFSRDDFIGCLELDLNNIIMPAPEPEKCTLKLMDNPQMVSLFKKKSMKGWWPCYVEDDENYVLTGKVEMTLEILTEKEAEERPAGKGRDPPNTNPTLSEPIRPETSFLWFQNIFKTFKFIGWRHCSALLKRREVVIAVVVVLFVLFALFFLKFILPLIL
ncbi:hypothetical protein XENTR_v10018236 [Xenopus tropicalis]|nr:hypothetical protein XENTR_v10018236 [Xenopus tropicalis]